MASRRRIRGIPAEEMLALIGRADTHRLEKLWELLGDETGGRMGTEGGLGTERVNENRNVNVVS